MFHHAGGSAVDDSAKVPAALCPAVSRRFRRVPASSGEPVPGPGPVSPRADRKSRFLLLAALTVVLVASPTPASETPVLHEEAKLLASDGEADDRFGLAVSLSGDRALVGASSDDDLGDASGSVYVFERDGAGAWLEVEKLLASDGEAEDVFGAAVSLSGDRALVGAWRDDDRALDSGAAYVFEWQGSGAATEVAKLTAEDGEPYDYFGAAVSLSGDRALVGVSHDDDLAEDSGSAYVFERGGTGQWTQVAKLLLSEGAEIDYFGSAVSLWGERALVGAKHRDDLAGNAGAAYIFEPDAAGDWREVAQLLASDGETQDFFGWSVSLLGDRALIGAVDDDDLGAGSGAAYVYEREASGEWVELTKLRASDGGVAHFFGVAVSLWGERALVGAEGADAAYLFERDEAGSWLELAKLVPSDQEDDRFGSEVSLGGESALAGAWIDDDQGTNSGSAYVFSFEGCVLELRLESPVVRAGDDLQLQLALRHRRLETVTVPFVVWIENEAGTFLAGDRTAPITFHHGDTLRQELTLRVPADTPPGRYRVLVGIDQMQQGIAAGFRPFGVVEPGTVPRPR